LNRFVNLRVYLLAFVVVFQVCMHASRCLAVAGRFPACRDRLAELKMLTPEICRLLSHRHLPKLCQAACECVASLAQDSVLQLQLLQAGALWHLLIMLFDYDFTLDEGGVQRCESSNKQEVMN
jgi:DnaJ family protein C protein 13